MGLGLETARHFCRLGAAKVVLACRDPDKGEAARADIEASCASAPSSTKSGVVEVWQVDMSSFQSVRDFCARAAAELDRLDVVVENAGVATGTYVEADGGFESTIAINVVSTFLMLLLLLPLLRRTAARFNVEPRVVIVSSDAHLFVSLDPLFFWDMPNVYLCSSSRPPQIDSLTRKQGQIQRAAPSQNIRRVQGQAKHERGPVQRV